MLCCDAARRGSGTREDRQRLAEDIASSLGSADDDRSVVISTPSAPSDGIVDAWWRRLQPRGGREALWRISARKALTAAKFLTGDYSQSWQPFAAEAAKIISRHVRIDACLGEHGPSAGIYLARAFAHEWNVPWVADFRDPILRPFGAVARPLYAARAKRLLASAAAVVEVTPYWAQLAQQQFGRPTACIPNGYDPEEFAEPRSASDASGTFRILYSGHINRPEQRLDEFMEGLSILRNRFPATYADVRFIYRGSASGYVLNTAARFGVTDVVTTAPHIDRNQALGELRAADMLLLLSVTCDRGDVYLRRGVYPAKAFEYFGAGRPILCTPGDAGVLDDLIAETATGVIGRTAEDIARVIHEGVSHRRTTGAVPYIPNRQVVAKYTRESAARRLARVLDGVIAGAPAIGSQA